MRNFAIKSVSLVALLSMSGLALADGEGGIDVAKNFSALADLAGFIGAAVGFILFAGSLYQIYEASSGRSDKKIGKSLLGMIIGAFLVSAGWVYEVLKASFLAGSKNGVDLSQGQVNLALDSAVLGASGAVGQASGLAEMIPASTIQSVIAFVFLVGFISFLNGVFEIKNIGDNRSEHPVMKPIVKIIGGMICMNILWFGCMISSILGIPGLCAE